jgi:hypothetical protein
MTDQRPLIERILDVVVYAPIGLVGQLNDEVPKLAAEGRNKFENRVQVAKFVGKMSVDFGRKELSKRWAQHRSASDVQSAAEAAPAPQPVAQAPSADVASSKGSSEPFDAYDSMTASEIVQRLARCNGDQLSAVERYERSHRNRRTILAKVAKLQASS